MGHIKDLYEEKLEEEINYEDYLFDCQVVEMDRKSIDQSVVDALARLKKMDKPLSKSVDF